LNSKFYNNTVFVNTAITNSGGGAILNNNSGSLNISNCDFENNSARNLLATGAAYLGWGAIVNSGATAKILKSTFTNNFVNGTSTLAQINGGAIYNTAINLLINDSSFVNNKVNKSNSNGSGGAIWTNGTNLVINHSRFENNFASSLGGAILINGSETLVLKILLLLEIRQITLVEL